MLWWLFLLNPAGEPPLVERPHLAAANRSRQALQLPLGLGQALAGPSATLAGPMGAEPAGGPQEAADTHDNIMT